MTRNLFLERTCLRGFNTLDVGQIQRDQSTKNECLSTFRQIQASQSIQSFFGDPFGFARPFHSLKCFGNIFILIIFGYTYIPYFVVLWKYFYNN